MKNNYPWYDSQWLSSYVQAKKIINQHQPALFDKFVNTMDVLKTRTEFQVIKMKNLIDESTLQEIKELIKEFLSSELEKQELFKFGRLVVHDHSYFNRMQISFTELVCEIAQEPVEPYYNFLSLYNNLGVCEMHMDALFAKWTLDICIEQSEPWPIYLSQVVPWPEFLKNIGGDWENQIKNDSGIQFSEYNLNPGEGIVFFGQQSMAL